jgi:hypothetical protein
VQVSGLTGAVAVAGSGQHSLAVRSDGTVWAWGYNYFGQLGNGTNTNSNVPVQVSGLTGAVAVAGGDFHSLALRSDGTARAWGRNVFGELGNGTTTDSNVPVQVSGLTGAVAIAGGGSHSLATIDRFISGFSQFAAAVGKGVTIKGFGFTGATEVTFSGVAANFRVLSDTKIKARVPNGALSGPVTVSTPEGTITSPRDFKVKPTVSSFSPSSGSVGTLVTIHGSAFTGATGVRFNGAAATFTVDAYGRITATVPAGATTGRIEVQTSGGYGKSATDFIVT